MENITIKKLQDSIFKIDNTPNAIDKYFQKLVEEVGELSRAMRKDIRLKNEPQVDINLFVALFYR